MITSMEVEYVHQFEYRTLNSNHDWSEPEIRYHNPTPLRRVAEDRHKECKDVEHDFGHEFEGIYGYSWKNCRLVKRTKTVEITVLYPESEEEF